MPSGPAVNHQMPAVNGNFFLSLSTDCGRRAIGPRTCFGWVYQRMICNFAVYSALLALCTFVGFHVQVRATWLKVRRGFISL